jgi:protein-L-isoaspartate(D-aspartate) O-methyltransferase
MSARAVIDGTDGLGQGRARLAQSLQASGRAGGAVSAALLKVPRHVFLPEIEVADAYRDAAIVVKSDAGGLAVSASTQPAMMAIMLEQLGLDAGQRVLEIGAGTGYNAAVMAQLVGGTGVVVTIDVEPDLVVRARASLAAAGCCGVTVICGDGADGAPSLAPYDRIIVTAGVWDLAPQWLAQLRNGGRIVLPISVRGIQLSVAFARGKTGIWVSESARRCQFIRMTGASSGPELVVPLGPQPGLHALVADGPAPRADLLYEVLSGPAAEASAGLHVGSISEVADLDLWLTLTEPDLTRLNLLGRHEGRANEAQQRIACLMPLGGYARTSRSGELAVAAVSLPLGTTESGTLAVAVNGYGAGGGSLADHLAERAAVWDGLGRPGADSLKLSAYPAGALPRTSAETTISQRPNVALVAGWPTKAA